MKEKEIRLYRNYIFDLYGTLIDIWTDETKPNIWRDLAGLYSRYGMDYEPGQLRRYFRQIEKEARKKQAEAIGTEYPEIRIEEIYLKLIREAHCRYKSKPMVEDAVLAEIMANTFRQMSIKRFKLFPETKKVLQYLRENGHRIFLLSNAQKVFTMPEIEVLDLTGYFDNIYLSSDHGMCKPDISFLKMLMEHEKLDPGETVMVGDDPASDMRMALEYGLDGVLINSRHFTLREIARQLGKPETSITIFKSINRILPKDIRLAIKNTA